MTTRHSRLQFGIFLALAVALVSGAMAANGDSTQVWAGYEYQQRVKEKMRAFGTLRYSELIDRDKLIGDWSKLQASGGLSYDLARRIRVEGGLGIYQTWAQNAPDPFEARAWQAVTFDWPEVKALARWVVHHRFMLEERFRRVDDWDMSLRGRYRLAFTVPFNRYTVEPGAFFLPMSAEFFTNQKTDNQGLFASKSRLSVGLGYMFNKTWTVELRYEWQERRDTLGADFQADGNIIDLRFKTTVRILDYLKSR